MSVKFAVLSALSVATFAGCASVSVHKVGSDGNVSGPDGVRFYRPRPYLSVHEPFVIASKAYVATGRLTPDGRFVVLTKVPAELAARIAVHDDKAVVEAAQVVAPAQRTLGGSVQNGKLLDKAMQDAPKVEEVAKSGDAGTATKTGQLNIRLTNDNKAYAFQPGRKYFDLVFLPDFEEDYVVSAKPNLGNASADIALGQGWSLQGMAVQVDNEALNRRVFALMDDSQRILTAAARAALGIPAVGGGPQAGTLTSADKAFKGGTPISVKATVVRVVAPGLYKILKPAEQAKFSAQTASTSDPGFRDRVLVPIAPLTDIAFNTYEVLVFEAIPMAGDSPLRMHQAFDVSIANAPGGEPSEPVDLSSLESQVNAHLASTGMNATAKLSLSADGTTIRVKLQPQAGSTLTDKQKQQIISDIEDSLKASGKSVELEP